ncbi:MAG: FliA/WhiG family RNA polymerase sigma factor [Planctomycetota bacterium]|nr:FliA/WhiG family RNA polymerase sigma factor [Planctomycetota bacterium]
MGGVWTEFKGADAGQRRDDLRNQLVEAYHYLVKVIGNRIAARLPRSIDVQDLRSAGVFGLMRAIENYDLARGTPFASYCATRIRGAILDELRAQDWVPRLVRNRASTYNETFARLQKRLGREPSNHELTSALQMTPAEVEKMRRESNLTSVYTLNQQDGDEDDPNTLRKLDALMDRGSAQPFDKMVAKDLARSLMTTLAENERTVIALYYHEGITMKEIGRVMRISESRVCQIHTKTLKKLKAHLDKMNEERAEEEKKAPAPTFSAIRRPASAVH